MKLGKLANGAKKRIVRIGTGVATVSAMAIPAFAAEGDTTSAMNTALQTGLTSVSSNINSSLIIVLPIALGIVAMTFGIKYAMRFFKSIAKG